MSKHTKGPWEFVEKLTPSENHRGYFIRAEKATRNGKWALAEVQPGDEDGNLGLANARLIAQAPEMLEVIRTTYAMLHQQPIDYAVLGEMLWQAIRRADGEQP